MPSKTYTIEDFLKYPDFAFNLAMIAPVSYNKKAKKSAGGLLHRLKRLWFIFGSINLVYQNFGLLIYLLAPNVQRIDENEPTMALIFEMGSIMGLTLVAGCNMFVLYTHRERITWLIQEFQQLFPSAAMQRRPKGNAKRDCQYRTEYFFHQSDSLQKLYTIFCICAFWYYNLLPLVHFIYESLSPEHQISYRYQSNTWYPWQTNSNAKTFLPSLAAYLCQMQSSLTGDAFIIAGVCMVNFFITQMQIHFDYVANALTTLDARSADANQQLKYLIRYHNRLLCFSEEINRIFSISFLVNLFTCTFAIGMMSLSMVLISFAHAAKYSVGLLFFLFFALFICYNGSQFTKSSEVLMPAAFYGNWYEGDLAYRKMILFFLMRSKKPNALEAYKFATVSMETYMAILKSAYQLFTFFNAMY